jgi:hypothetical protein
MSRHAKYLLGVVQDRMGRLGGPQVMEGRLNESEKQALQYAMALRPKAQRKSLNEIR